MRFLTLLLLLVIGLEAAEQQPFQMTNDSRFQAALDRLLAVPPGPGAYPEQEFRWLGEVAVAADRNRRYDIAEAAMAAITQRWPYLGMPWGGLSCYQGKQGKWSEALESVRQGRERPRPDRQQFDGISSVWLWQLGKQDEARAVLTALPKPADTDTDLPMWLVCQAFFHASCDRDMAATRQAIEKLLALPDVGHWRYFLARDVAFDVLRQEPWFIALIGPTATGTPDSGATPFKPVTPLPVVETLRRMGDRPDERQARVELATALKQLAAGSWQDAVSSADRSLALVELAEAHVVRSLGLAALDQPTPCMDAIRQISHQGLQLAAWPTDIDAIYLATEAVLNRVVGDAKSGKGFERPVAMALIIYAHFYWAWHEHDQVIRMMDAAERWCPTLAEVPNTRALARVGQKDWAGAAADLQTAVKLNSGFFDAHLNQAYIRREQGFPAEAMTLFDAAQKHGGAHRGTELHRIAYLAAAGRIDEAMTALDVALAQPKPHRNLVSTLWQVSTSCSEARRFPEAERLTRLVLQRNPTIFDAWTKLSGDLARQGKFAEAAACARNHLDGNPDAYDGQLALAAWLVHLGQRDEANALAASAKPPLKDAERIGHYHGIRAIYDAACSDEAAMQHSMTEMLKAPDPERQRRWYRKDPLFDAFRAKPWFVALIGESPAK